MKLRFVNIFLIKVLLVLFSLQVQAAAWPKTLTQKQLASLGGFNGTRIQADDPVMRSLFGTSVAVDGNRAIVGAMHPAQKGHAYVFEFDGTLWHEMGELIPDASLNRSAKMGYSVAISGDIAVVGAPGAGDWTTAWGNVYVYRYNGVKWQYEATLTHTSAVFGERIGYSLAIEGSTIVVGAMDSDSPYFASGSVHIFEFLDNDWQRTAVFKPNDSNDYQLFGHSVAIDNKRILIGSSRDYGYATQYGAVYVLEHDGFQWKKTAKLTVSKEDVGSEGYFGSRVALKGDVALIGSHEASDIERDSGAAYIFRYQGGAWVQEARLKASDVKGAAHFGSCVALSDDVAVVGAYAAESQFDIPGAVYVFRRENLTWSEQTKLIAANNIEDGMEFGYSCDIQGDRLMVGAPYHASAGSVFVYDLDK